MVGPIFYCPGNVETIRIYRETEIVEIKGGHLWLQSHRLLYSTGDPTKVYLAR